MSLLGLVLRGLRHYRRTHLGVLAGMIIASATLLGALLVGDSVRHSLMRGSLARIGAVHNAMSSGDRFFQASLAERMQVPCAPVISMQAVGSSSTGDRRLHDIQVLGVESRFFELAPETSQIQSILAGEAWVNGTLAARLQLVAGEEVVLRVELPSALPRDMALAPGEVAVALRLRVAGVLDRGSFAEFGLYGGSSERPNVLVNLVWLQEQLQVPGAANLMLSPEVETETLNRALAQHWQLEDAQLEVSSLADGRRELRTDRIFFDAPILEKLEALGAAPLEGVFTYFVNGLRKGENSIPYSMVSALGPLNPVTGAGSGIESALVQDLEPGKILLGEWAREDLDAQPGDPITLDFYVIDASRQLVERSQSFLLAGTIPMQGLAADRSLMPAFPGLADADNCRDWEPGTPVDLDRIRDKDEVYWDEYGGAPKAFLRLEDGRDLWTSRFGALTAVRFDAAAEPAVRNTLLGQLSPAELGLFFQDVRTSALAGGDSATDFGGLFIGLSFFLIVAALLLATQLFLFGVEQRASEIGLYAALGFERSFVRKLLLLEVGLLACVGAGLGALFGLGYTKLVLFGLASVWQGAIASVHLEFHAQPSTLLVGWLISVLASLATAHFALRKTLRRSSARLLSAKGPTELDETPLPGTKPAGRPWFAIGGLGAALLAVLLVDPAGGPSAAGAFFGAGALTLTCGLVLCRRHLRRSAGRGSQGLGSALSSSMGPGATLASLGRSNTRRRPSRSLATIALMASGTFLVVAIGANRLGPTQNTLERASGTGGFALFGQSSLPVVHDMNSKLGRDALGLGDAEMDQVSVVPMRMRQGDDASCLNLARPQAPPLFGVQSAQLSERGAFEFAATSTDTTNPWLLLQAPQGDGAIPAIGDVTSLTWQMHKGVGDTLQYVNERGEPFDVRIVGAVADSILQGALLIEEQHFETLFPTQGGHRRFLIDAPADRAAEVSATLSRALRDLGFAAEPSGQRLDAFHAVQNTYLTIFQGLGLLGLLLGTVGLGMLLLRNTLERRAELALARALGFSSARLRWWVLSEYGYLLLLGLACGAGAALVAILPAMRAPGSELSLNNFWMLCCAVAASGFFWLWLATRVAVRQADFNSLREE